MKIAIIGSGAVGLFYGAELQRKGEDVHYLFRSDYDIAKRDGVTVKKREGGYVLKEINAHCTSGSIGICDLVIVSIKTTSNLELPELLKPLVGPATIIITMQNGLGNDALLASWYPSNPILAGLCFICLNRIAPAVVENFIEGSISIGPARGEFVDTGRRIAEMFKAAGVVTRYEENLQLVQWKKLVWNVPFNGLAIVIGGLATDAIVESPALLGEVRGLMEEVIHAAGALGLAIKPSFIELQIERTIPMGAYKPSSMIDFVEGRQVEVEAIWGEPLRQAKAAGASMPKLEILYALLQKLCKR